MRGLFLDNLTGLVGDVFKGVANSTSRMKESVLFHNGEEEKKYKQMEERKNKEVAKLKEELKERDKQVEERNKLIKAKEEELKTREEKAKEDDAKHKEEVAKLKAEVEERNKQIEERNKQIKAKEDELKTREERAKEDEAKYKEEVARLKGEMEETNKQVEETNKQMEETNKQIKAKEKELKTREEKIDKLKKKLDDKDGIIGELRKHNAGLKVAFDLNAGVIMQMQDWDAKIEEANLKAANFKRSRQELEETTGPEMKKVCVAVNQLRSKKQEVVANGLQMLEASAKIIGPAVAQSKNQKRRAQRERAKKGNKYCGICKDFFRLDL